MGPLVHVPAGATARPRSSRSLLSGMRKRLLGISPEEADLTRRGFAQTDDAKRARLEEIGRAFVAGYNLGLVEDEPGRLAAGLAREGDDLDGFRFEGAAMALHLRDMLWPVRRRRWQAFVAEHGDRYAYLQHVGAGWALARLRRPVRGFLRRTDPLLGWLAVDGYGFHEGYFRSGRYVAPPLAPGPFAGYAGRVFDQGLGRSVWFSGGADVDRVAGCISRFPPARRDDLWSGAGLAATYAGGCDARELVALARAAGTSVDHLRQGVVFAAAARHRAGSVTAHTEAACRALLGVDAEGAAAIARAALPEPEAVDEPEGSGEPGEPGRRVNPGEPEESGEPRRGGRGSAVIPSYERWRAGIRAAVRGSA